MNSLGFDRCLSGGRVFGKHVLKSMAPSDISAAISVISGYSNRATSTALVDDSCLGLGRSTTNVLAGYTALASKVLTALRDASHIRAMNRVFGGLFVVAGTLLALFKRSG